MPLSQLARCGQRRLLASSNSRSSSLLPRHRLASTTFPSSSSSFLLARGLASAAVVRLEGGGQSILLACFFCDLDDSMRVYVEGCAFDFTSPFLFFVVKSSAMVLRVYHAEGIHHCLIHPALPSPSLPSPPLQAATRHLHQTRARAHCQAPQHWDFCTYR